MRVFIVILTAVLLSACSAIGSTETLPTVMLDSGGSASTPEANVGTGGNASGVTASGIVVPASNARLALTLGGSVKAVPVAEGDKVDAGQTLLELDDAAIQLEIAAAERNLREMTSDAAIAAAEQAVAAAEKAVEDAQKKVNSLNRGRADEKDIDYYESQLTLAKQALDRAESAWRNVTELSTADPKRAKAETDLYNAQRAYNAALANLNWAKGKPSDNDFATAEANLAAAQAAYQEAQWYLATLRGEPVPEDATGKQLAMLQQAKDSLTAAQNRLTNSRLLAPFSGTVVAMNVVPGEYVLPGQALVELSDVANLQVETTDLSERDVPDVNIGQAVTVVVDALSREISGRVIRISPQAETLGGDVVYRTVIALDNPPQELRAGMSVDVLFGE
jgi:multidrug efflux pump subunit AcrA (membrane-fusion protein)